MKKRIAPWLRIVREQSPIPYNEGIPKGTAILGPRDVGKACARMDRLETEHFVVIHLDAQHRVISQSVASKGILNSSLVHPREVFREAIAVGAASVVLVHNHPSGLTDPSADDKAVTSQLVAAGRLLDIPVHDHVIIGDDRWLSFAEQGLI